eukprot:SAG31_NODE_12028_length_976_cov_0.985177_2_plen_36_part_01
MLGGGPAVQGACRSDDGENLTLGSYTVLNLNLVNPD